MGPSRFRALVLLAALSAPASEAAVSAPVLKWKNGGCFSSWCQTGWYSSPAIADLDRDGNPDVVWGSYDLVALNGRHGSAEVARRERQPHLAGGGGRRPHGRRHPGGRRRPERGPGDRLQRGGGRPLVGEPVRLRGGADAGGRGPRARRPSRGRGGPRERRRHEAAPRLLRGGRAAGGLARAARRRGRLRLGHVQRERRRRRPRRGRLQGADRPYRHALHHRPRPDGRPAPGERDVRRGQGLEPGGRARGPRGGPPRLRELRGRAPAELRG